MSVTNAACRRLYSVASHCRSTAAGESSVNSKVMEMTQKSFAQGSTCPALKPGVMRIYSMRFCPYAQRTRLVLVHKNIPFETVNINLKSKPDWFLERNPLGLVPVLEKDDTIIYESTATCEWLDDIYPENRLQPSDPYRKAWDRMLLEYFGKVTGSFYGIFLAKSEEDRVGAIEKLHTHFKYYEDVLVKRGGPYFGGDQPAMIDFYMWPHMERIPALAEKYSNAAIEKSRYPKLSGWFDIMYTLPAVKATMFENKMHQHFMHSFSTGTPDYDAGLEE